MPQIRNVWVVILSEGFAICFELVKTTIILSSVWMEKLIEFRRPIGLRCDAAYVSMSRKNIGRGICYDALAKLIVTGSLNVSSRNDVDSMATFVAPRPGL